MGRRDGWCKGKADAESETKIECDEITERIVSALRKNAVNNAILMPMHGSAETYVS